MPYTTLRRSKRVPKYKPKPNNAYGDRPPVEIERDLDDIIDRFDATTLSEVERLAVEKAISSIHLLEQLPAEFILSADPDYGPSPSSISKPWTDLIVTIGKMLWKMRSNLKWLMVPGNW